MARAGITVAVFGDVMKVPGESGSLNDAKAEGADVRVVFGVDDAVALARRSKKDVVFMGIGFETTAPTTASALLSDPPPNFSVLSCHRTVPPALKAIAGMGEIRLNGMIEPGHVSAIIGTKPYEFLSKDFGMPQVVAGFEPLDLMMGVYMLAKQVREGRAEVENEYSRVVHSDGNPAALRAIAEAFEPTDVVWRGFPVIAGSGLEVRSGLEAHDARKRYEDLLKPVHDREYSEAKGCRCGEMLRGIAEERGLSAVRQEVHTSDTRWPVHGVPRGQLPHLVQIPQEVTRRDGTGRTLGNRISKRQKPWFPPAGPC